MYFVVKLGITKGEYSTKICKCVSCLTENPVLILCVYLTEKVKQDEIFTDAFQLKNFVWVCVYKKIKNSISLYFLWTLNLAYISVRNLNLWKLRGFQAVVLISLQSLYRKDGGISFLRVNSNFPTRGIHQ